MATFLSANVKIKDFAKCGDITTSLKVGKKVYALNCIFCTTICVQLETFALHIEENHSNELCIGAQSEEEEEQCTSDILDNDPLYSVKLQQQSDVEETSLRDDEKEASLFKNKHDITIDCEDPLQEAPKNRNVEESAVCIVDVKKEEELNERTTSIGLGITKEEQKTDDDMDITYEELENNTDCSETESDSELEADNDDDILTENDATNKDLLLAIIAGYEKHPILWDPNDANAKNRKKREDALKKISQAVKRKLSVTLSTKSIGERIKKMRYKFRSELQNRKLSENKCDTLTSASWYFDKLGFLSKTITYKPRNKRGAKALANEKPSLPLANLTEDQNTQLIDIYKSFPCLWDMQHIGFRFKTQRSEALDEMIQAVKSQMKLNLTQDELQKKLYRIRYACTQEKHRKLQCERIQKEFKPTTHYYDRIAFLVDNVGPFKCDFCEETFNGADQYRIHKSKHDGSMPFICPICNRGFMKVGNCTVHVRRHTRDYPFECKECGKRFATTTDVNVHMRYHTGEKPYFCEVCGQSFRTWSFFDAHMRRHQKRPSHTCTICAKAFYENNKLTEHMKAHLNVRDKVCNICGKAFTSSKYLRQHKQIHAEKKKYVCKICNKDFAQYAGLSGHMKSHGTTVSGGTVGDEHH